MYDSIYHVSTSQAAAAVVAQCSVMRQLSQHHNKQWLRRVGRPVICNAVVKAGQRTQGTVMPSGRE